MAIAGSETRAASAAPPSPFLVALAGWAVPGLGYVLFGQRARGVTVGVTVVALFVLGLLIGGIRVLEVPTYSREGKPVPEYGQTYPRYLWREVQTKPWSIAQVMTGPVALAAGAVTVNVSRPPRDETGNVRGEAPAAESHARVNEIGVLYTAVAGMLNLLAVIDSAHRAQKLAEAK